MKKMVSLIGNAEVDTQSSQFQVAYDLGKLLIDHNYRLVTGGLSGIMEAACRGARNAKNYREGDIVGVLPVSDPKLANGYVDIPIATTFGLARNVIIANSHAVIAVGGGSGTLSEMAFAWQFYRLILAWRGNGWSSKLADTRIDYRERYAEEQEDKVFGFDTAQEALLLLNDKINRYTRRLSRF